MELLEAVKELLRKDWGVIVNRLGGGVYVVTNEGAHEYGEDMGERSIYFILVGIKWSGDLSGGHARCYHHWTGTVGGLFNCPPLKLPNFNFLNTAIKNILFNT